MIPPVSIVPIISPEIFPAKNLAGKICLSPFVSIEIALGGEVRLCGCSGWMPTSIGNIFNTPLHELLSSPLAKTIRQTIIDGTYNYCNEKLCGIIRNNLLNSVDTLSESVFWQIQDSTRYCMPHEIYISGDLTCNLSCPSCRTKVIKLSPKQKQQQEKLIKVLANNIFSKPTDQDITLTLSTTGELFASNFLLSFVREIPLDHFPNVNLSIQTNGLLCEQNWEKLGSLQHRVKQIVVTIDAAQPDTYKKLRRGGNWDQIISSMTWLQQKKKQNNMKLFTRMIVQKENYKQIEDFYKLSKLFDADRVEYGRIKPWGTMSDYSFTDIDVLNTSHPLYNEVMDYWHPVKYFADVVSWG